jgi:hypothetical protein
VRVWTDTRRFEQAWGWYKQVRQVAVGAMVAGAAAPTAVMAGAGAYYMAPPPFFHSFLLIFLVVFTSIQLCI